jgi:predicted nucleic acid-binding protein
LKLIVDTCVWSLSLRRQGQVSLSADEVQVVAQLREAIQDRRAVILGPVRQEILSGIRDATQFAKTEQFLEPFRDEEVRAEDYVAAARLFNRCQNRGIQCGPVDILLCAVAARKRFGILTSDRGLKRCIEILKSEGHI